MKNIYEALPMSLNLDSNLILNIVYTVFILLIGWILKIVFLKTIWSKIEQNQARFTIRKLFNYVITIISILIISSFWIEDFTQVGTFFGLFTAAIAITLKDLFVNIAGWLFIILRRPFAIGDRIQIGTFAGDVIDIRIFQFSILEIGNWVEADQSTGRIINIPNGQVFVHAQANYNKGFDYIWNEVKVLITFESDWELAKKILTEIITEQNDKTIHDAKKQIRAASRQYLISYSNLEPVVYTSVRDSGVLLTVRYLCKPRSRRQTENDLWEKMLIEFKEHRKIGLAYPTQRYYFENEENKQKKDY